MDLSELCVFAVKNILLKKLQLYIFYTNTIIIYLMTHLQDLTKKYMFICNT